MLRAPIVGMVFAVGIAVYFRDPDAQSELGNTPLIFRPQCVCLALAYDAGAGPVQPIAAKYYSRAGSHARADGKIVGERLHANFRIPLLNFPGFPYNMRVA